jgi:hypothetical protein
MAIFRARGRADAAMYVPVAARSGSAEVPRVMVMTAMIRDGAIPQPATVGAMAFWRASASFVGDRPQALARAPRSAVIAARQHTS